MSDRLKTRLALRSDLVVLVGVPVDAPRQWCRATSYTATEIVTPDGRFPIAAVKPS